MRTRLLFLIFLFPFVSFAQTLKEFDLQEMNEQQIPVFIDYPNSAALVIYSAIPNILFKSNTDGIVGQRNELNKTIIFIRPEKQVITIQAPDFQELKFKSELTEAKTTRFYRLNSKETNYRPDKGSVVINTVPSGAYFTIDGFPDFGQFTPYELKDYEARSYRIKLELRNYTSLDTTLVIEKGLKQTKTFFLETTVGFLTLSYTRPVDALLNAEKIKVDTEPITYTLKAGQQTLKIQEPGYEVYNQNFVLKPGEYLKKEIVLVKLEGVALFDFPSAVEVKINEQTWRKPEGTQTRVLAPGTYQITVFREGYEPWKTEVAVKHKEQVRVNPEFKVKKSKLTVNVTPDGARVMLSTNGQERALGFAPVNTEILPGNYDLKISADGYEPETRNIKAQNGDPVSFQIALKRTAGIVQPPVYSEPKTAKKDQPKIPKANIKLSSVIYAGWTNSWFGTDEYSALEEDKAITRSPFGLALGFRQWFGSENKWSYDAQVFFAQSVQTKFDKPFDQLYLGGISFGILWNPLVDNPVRPHFTSGVGIINLGESFLGLPSGEHLLTKHFFIGIGMDLIFESTVINLEYKRSLVAEKDRTLNQIQISGGFLL